MHVNRPLNAQLTWETEPVNTLVQVPKRNRERTSAVFITAVRLVFI